MNVGDWVKDKATGRVGYVETIHSTSNITVGWYRNGFGNVIYPRKSVGVYFPKDLELLGLDLDENELKGIFTEIALATKDFNWLRELYKEETV